ncbi:cryptochrome/photolyase family protein, partial [Acaryochloris sp. IP29b_bin.148]|uniref:cryptochrome/photolyase family protein n=1 Tax=Acaryochloris sp. IP29b_bin.148 TaxID=2969218 RepID=UPI00261CD8B5
MESSLIYPHQLYDPHPAITPTRIVFLIEEPLFFRQYPFHKHKIILHRASMQSYAHRLQDQGHTVRYLDSQELDMSATVLAILHRQGIQAAHTCEVTDDWLEQRLSQAAEKYDIHLIWHPTPNFLTPTSEYASLLPAHKSLRMNSFYIKQRQQLGILLEGEHPVGGKWSFDTDNRKRLPKTIDLPSIQWPTPNRYVQEALAYTQQHFPDNPGSSYAFRYPIDHNSARTFLHQFLDTRIDQYGT